MLSPIWILLQGFDSLPYFLYISLPLIIIILISIYLLYKKKRNLSKKVIYTLLYFIALPIVIALLGGLFYDTDSTIVSFLILGLYFGGIIYFIYLLIKMKNYRLFLFSVISLILFFTFWVMFTAGMSIANDWI